MVVILSAEPQIRGIVPHLHQAAPGADRPRQHHGPHARFSRTIMPCSSGEGAETGISPTFQKGKLRFKKRSGPLVFSMARTQFLWWARPGCFFSLKINISICDHESNSHHVQSRPLDSVGDRRLTFPIVGNWISSLARQDPMQVEKVSAHLQKRRQTRAGRWSANGKCAALPNGGQVTWVGVEEP